MAKQATKVDATLLQMSIDEAEGSGALPNLSELWVKTTSIYNSKVSYKFPKIVTSAAMNNAKKLSLTHKTKAGKRGRPVIVPGAVAPVGIATRGGTNILAGITDWADTEVVNGKFAGQKFKRRWVVVCDKYCWGVMQERENGSFAETTGFGYAGCFRILLEIIRDHAICDVAVAVDRIVQRLAEVTGVEVVIDTRLSAGEIGRQIDLGFKVSHGKDLDVYKRIFKAEPVETVEVANEVD